MPLQTYVSKNIFQFGTGIADGRSSPWQTFERILSAAVAGLLAGWGYRRDEGERYR